MTRPACVLGDGRTIADRYQALREFRDRGAESISHARQQACGCWEGHDERRGGFWRLQSIHCADRHHVHQVARTKGGGA